MSWIKKYYTFIFGAAVVTALILSDSLKESEKFAYRKSSEKSEIVLTKKDIKLSVPHKLNYPSPPEDETFFESAKIYNAIPIAFAVTDLNQDDYIDLCTVRPEYKDALKCFQNKDGKELIDVTKELNLPEIFEYMPSAVYSADFNNDGMSDILVVSYGRHRLFLRDSKGFRSVENAWFSNAWGANFSDFNNDGLLDVIFANYFAKVDLNKNRVPWYYSGISDKSLGDFNEVWINKGNGLFEQDTNIFPKLYSEHTTSIGISDFDRDGKLNIFEGNDYSIDRMYKFDESKNQFVEITENSIPKIHHGFSGMNTEFFDLNKDGFLDLYVSNIVIPPLLGLSNIMWMYDPKVSAFKQVAAELKIDKCGYGWTAKAVDFNIDSENEIVSASGFYTSEVGKVNLLFYRLIMNASPKWFPSRPMPINARDFSIAIKSSPCLFHKAGEKYEDISESTIDWNKNKASRSLVILDFNNDGKTDLIIPEHGGEVVFYLNETVTENNWLGLKFNNQFNSKIVFGAQVEIFNDENGKRIDFFETNSVNGFKNQHDFRKVIGLGKAKKITVKIKYNGNLKVLNNLEINKYNEIQIY